MNQLRKDYLVDRWVIIAEDRGKRPTDFVCKCFEVEPRACFFCPGSEDKTPPEIDRVEEDGKWVIRCFPNKFPATTEHYGEPESIPYPSMPAYGRHEVIVETPNHSEHLSNLSEDHLIKVLDMYSKRICELKKDPLIKYVMLFKNQGKDAGASLDHSHTQLIALPVIPSKFMREVEASEEYMRSNKSCPYCDTWKKERTTERLIYEDEYTIAFTPYASRFPFEARIMPKRHVKTLDELTDEEKKSFAGVMKKLLQRLDTSLNNPPYNFWLRYSPDGYDLHMYLELAPRLAKFAGMELGSDIIINVVPPESAAKHYRGD